jgi:hypothetical protein
MIDYQMRVMLLCALFWGALAVLFGAACWLWREDERQG